MPQTQTPRRFDRSDLLSALALFMSLGAIFVSVRQTTILKDQQLIMAEQQSIMASQMEGSVWPYLKTNISASDQDGVRSIAYTITNKGVGPAKIDHFSFTIGDKTITSAKELVDILTGLEEFERLISLGFSLPNSAVLAPNETHEVYKIDYQYDEALRSEFITLIGEEKMCYCSIYDKCYGNCEKASD